MARKFVSPQRAPKVEPPRLASIFKLPNFLSILHKRLRASGAWRHSHSVTRFVSDYCDIFEWHLRPPVRAHANTCINVCTLLTHVLSRKVFSLTKLKGMNRNPSAITLHWNCVFNKYSSPAWIQGTRTVGICFGFTFNDISTFMSYLMLKPSGYRNL